MGPSIENKFPYYSKARYPKQLYAAWRKVYSNGIRSQSPETRNSVKEFSTKSYQQIDTIYRKLLKYKFTFEPAHGVPIPRSQKSPRPIVVAPIPNRIVQRSILDVLQSVDSIKKYINTPFSFGGVKERSVENAVEAAQKLIEFGAKWYVKSDIENFFAKIPKQKVLQIISQLIPDSKFIDLFSEAINVELENMEHLGKKANLYPLYEIGVAQGCCLSPLIGNILLYNFDKKLNGDGVGCLRYIDDFLILAPTRKKALATFNSGLKILQSYGLNAYNPLIDNEKAKLDRVADGIDFLGCEILGPNIGPNRKSRESLLLKIDNAIKESKNLMRNPIECARNKKSFVDTLKSINNILEGWGNQYSFCNDYSAINKLDYKINKRLINYLNFYKSRNKSLNTSDFLNRRRLLGVHLLSDSFH